MKKIFLERDIRKARNLERCRIILMIIKGQAVFIKTQKERVIYKWT